MPFNPPNSRATNEIDIRSEIEQMFSGTGGEIAKQSTLVLRKMRKNNSGEKIGCSCLSSTTLEPDQEHQCPFCLGQGYLWDEIFIKGYKMPAEAKSRLQSQRIGLQPGQMPVYNKIFYVKYNETISREDIIVELKLDIEGAPEPPFRRTSLNRIESLIEYRSDRGRLEYFCIYANENPSNRRAKKSQ